MHLLNTATLKLEYHQQIPPYAILSHRWGEEEVTFRDINEPHAINMKGYIKIKQCCQHALKDGYRYAWVDTCCIDKSSSAELSEAINSMFSWYQKARVCYAYLEDVTAPIGGPPSPGSIYSLLSGKIWFTRGWTLQELIAPEVVIFLAKGWVEIGSKASLASHIARITGVDERVLSGALSLAKVSVAKKMSWAAKRETTRIEDRAYSLMGLFGVHMPLIYGEGKNAFTRLQGEIMRSSIDQSIFAWRTPLAGPNRRRANTLLASSPDDFRLSTTIDKMSPANFAHMFVSNTFSSVNTRSSFSITIANGGVQITLPIKMTSDGYLAVLTATSSNLDPGCPLVVRLKQLEDGSFARADISTLESLTAAKPYDGFIVRDVIISNEDVSNSETPDYPQNQVVSTRRSQRASLFNWSSPGLTFRINATQVAQQGWAWNPMTPGENGAVLYFNHTTSVGFLVTIGVFSHRPCVHTSVFSNVGNAIRKMENLILRSYSKVTCCRDGPDWVSVPLPSRRSWVTVTSRRKGGLHPMETHGYVISIQVTLNELRWV
ncbi:HET-domain-containing protein [Leucogyrophana mollusca]|uniref:HET-domain-containing protein n=1 Tax=Leucogyrophana mollusca TaxID=85980 RepID=A0ACB8BAZ8_9AGAM|nr:HET-domain-containing protein [Leucogyrophana mollusca]